jgi:phosphoglucan,water dikinase
MNNKFKILIGNQTSFSAASPMAPFEFAVANGFTAFEWFPDKKEDGQGFDLNDLTQKTRAGIKKNAKTHGMSMAVHAPWQASPLAPEGMTIFAESVRFAQDIGATLLNIHYDSDNHEAGFARALLPLITLTKQAGIRLAIENTVLTSPEEINGLFKKLNKLAAADIAHVGICFDMGHANLCSATRNDYIGYLDRLAGNIPIIHLHGHENFGDRDSHLPLFTGPAGDNGAGLTALLLRLAARNYNGSLILEQWPEPPTLLTEARDRIIKLITPLTTPKKKKARAKAAQKKSPNATPPLVAAIAAMDQQSRSWREKLLGVKDLLQENSHVNQEEMLTYLAIYLRFLNTGEITCVEDGRHFRPSHHARCSLEIQEMLFESISPQTIFLLRKILPWLPSFADDFMRHEPLTRIRDIAHRNDIPKDLKKEIKETLQNKLHRCAGPEDLQTAAEILNRITAIDADFSEGFVHEFQIFYAELQDFFNAKSLQARLAALDREDLDQTTRQAMEQFLGAKGNKKKSQKQLLEILEKNTRLRAALVPTAYRRTDPAAHHRRMAEIQLEDYGFALFSELINGLTKTDRSFSWPDGLRALALALSQLRLSTINPEECAVCESQLAAWAQKIDPQDRETLLLIHSLLNRCQRLAESYCEKILAIFAEKAETLGHLLAVPAHAIRTYAEGDIRGSMIFQLAKLTTLLQNKIREAANLPPWDIIVAGLASGRLTPLARLEDFRSAKGKEYVLLLAEATGSEEIPNLVAAIILCRPIPHLSHLAIRARQENIVLIALLDLADKQSLTGLKGKDIAITATADGVIISPKTSATNKKKRAEKIRKIPEYKVSLATNKTLLNLADTKLATCGNKAFGAGILARLGHLSKNFKAPMGVAIPFGVAAKALSADPTRFKKYEKLVKKLTDGPKRNLEQIIDGLQELYLELAVAPAISSQVAKTFKANTRLMVRSSANCEDLATMSGAGLYDSISNVSPQTIAPAIRRVWASLWSRRAIISRERAGIPHHQARMAILIQEMITPDYAFVLHTSNPMNNNRDELYLEMAVGHGETLASAALPGSPLRMICNKQNGKTQLLAFADFSKAARPDPREGLAWSIVDYSQDPLTWDRSFRMKTVARLCNLGCEIEKAFGSPQDIEGVIKDNEIYLVQARAQIKAE